MANKYTFFIIMLLIVSLFVAGILRSGEVIPFETFVFISLVTIFVPIGWVLFPLLAKWFEKKGEELDVIQCWEHVKKRLSQTTRILIPSPEYMPKRHKIVETFGIYICEIRPSDLLRETVEE